MVRVHEREFFRQYCDYRSQLYLVNRFLPFHDYSANCTCNFFPTDITTLECIRNFFVVQLLLWINSRGKIWLCTLKFLKQDDFCAHPCACRWSVVKNYHMYRATFFHNNFLFAQCICAISDVKSSRTPVYGWHYENSSEPTNYRKYGLHRSITFSPASHKKRHLYFVSRSQPLSDYVSRITTINLQWTTPIESANNQLATVS